MSNGIDLAAYDRPTIVEVWAPSCSECRAMQPDIDATAAKFADAVDTVKINAAQETEAVRRWNVMGTPTVIGISGGDEVFRFSGRRSRSEIEDAFNAVSSGGAVGKVGRQDVALRVGAGVALVGVGLATGPVWALVVVGSAVTMFGLVPWMKQQT